MPETVCRIIWIPWKMEIYTQSYCHLVKYIQYAWTWIYFIFFLEKPVPALAFFDFYRYISRICLFIINLLLFRKISLSYHIWGWKIALPQYEPLYFGGKIKKFNKKTKKRKIFIRKSIDRDKRHDILEMQSKVCTTCGGYRSDRCWTTGRWRTAGNVPNF